MNRAVLVFVAALVLAGCGIKRPLIRPSEIPAYEKQQQEKRDRYRDEQPTAAPEEE